MLMLRLLFRTLMMFLSDTLHFTPDKLPGFSTRSIFVDPFLRRMRSLLREKVSFSDLSACRDRWLPPG